MKLKSFKHQDNYRFILTFDNGETRESDLRGLLEKYVGIEGVATARIDPEWGCLEFNNGMVDIEPKTLYRHTYTA
jgi:hypothetical protein